MATKHPVYGWGYDLTKPRPAPTFTPPAPKTAPPTSAIVDFKFLPPAGDQGKTPSCWVWSSTYGVATVEAAIKGGFSPAAAADQASVGYTYVKVMTEEKTAPNVCSDGDPCSCFKYLKANGGAPTMGAAPTPMDCPTAWTDYGSNSKPADPRFQVESWLNFSIKSEPGLAHLRAVLAQGKPLVYCTSYYTDFESYQGTPSPYVGNGVIDTDQNGDPIGHCMMIAGYDDAMGAVLLLNSWSPYWGQEVNGAGGFVWMAWTTFQTLAQGQASYLSSPNAG